MVSCRRTVTVARLVSEERVSWEKRVSKMIRKRMVTAAKLVSGELVVIIWRRLLLKTLRSVAFGRIRVLKSFSYECRSVDIE